MKAPHSDEVENLDLPEMVIRVFSTLTCHSESESLRLDDGGVTGESEDDPFSSRLMSFEVTFSSQALLAIRCV